MRLVDVGCSTKSRGNADVTADPAIQLLNHLLLGMGGKTHEVVAAVHGATKIGAQLFNFSLGPVNEDALLQLPDALPCLHPILLEGDVAVRKLLLEACEKLVARCD